MLVKIGRVFAKSRSPDRGDYRRHGARRELQDELIRPTLTQHPRKATQRLSRIRCAYAYAVEQGRLPDLFNPPTLGIQGRLTSLAR